VTDVPQKGCELRVMEKAKPGPKDNSVPDLDRTIPTLADLGITKNQSSQWQGARFTLLATHLLGLRPRGITKQGQWLVPLGG
jgi:hypothetical protein